MTEQKSTASIEKEIKEIEAKIIQELQGWNALDTKIYQIFCEKNSNEIFERITSLSKLDVSGQIQATLLTSFLCGLQKDFFAKVCVGFSEEDRRLFESHARDACAKSSLAFLLNYALTLKLARLQREAFQAQAFKGNNDAHSVN